MANSFVRYNGDGSTSEYSVPFPYIDQDHVLIYVDGAQVGFEWLTAGTIKMDSTPANGSEVYIQRDTPREPLVDFEGGAIITEVDLDLLVKQNSYVAEETRDNSVPANSVQPLFDLTDEIKVIGNREDEIVWLYEGLQGAVYTSDLGSVSDPITDSEVGPESYLISVYDNLEAIQAAPQAAADAQTYRDEAKYWAEQAEQSAFNTDTVDFGTI